MSKKVLVILSEWGYWGEELVGTFWEETPTPLILELKT